MSGVGIKVPVTLSNPGVQIFKNDPILAPGALWLYDSRRSFRTAGVPTNGAKLDNVAYNEAKTLIASGTEDTLAGVFTLAAGTNMTVERSSKGGLHTIFSPSAASAGVGVEIQAPDLVKQYVINNAGHAWYFSAWHFITRNPKTASEGGSTQHHYGMIKRNAWSTAHIGMNYTQNTSRFAWSTFTGGRGAPDGLAVNSSGTTAPYAGRIAAAYTARTTAPFWQSNTGVTPVPPVTPSEFLLGATMGRVHPSNGAVGLGSRIVYRVYLEDLTVSGRTPAEVDAIGDAEFLKATTGTGSFANDTYTDPVSVYAT